MTGEHQKGAGPEFDRHQNTANRSPVHLELLEKI